MLSPDGRIELNQSSADYHAHPALSRSQLARFEISPYHYWDKYEAPDREPSEETKATSLGTAIHSAILEPDTFDDRYLIVPKVNRTTTVGKASAAEFELMAKESGKSLLLESDAKTAFSIRKAVSEHPKAGPIIASSGLKEVSFYWTDPETGIPCKCRMDLLALKLGIILDAKSARSVDETQFEYSIEEYCYHFQFPFYNGGVKAVLGMEMEAFIYLALEKVRPFGLKIFVPDPVAIAAGHNQVRSLMRRFAECREKNEWPSYSTDIKTIGLPRRLLQKYGIDRPRDS